MTEVLNKGIDMEISESLLKAFGIIDEDEVLFLSIQASEIDYVLPHVGLRKVLEKDGRLSLDIVIDSQTKKEHLKDMNLWSRIEEEWEAITAAQGHDLTDYQQVLLQEWMGD